MNAPEEWYVVSIRTNMIVNCITSRQGPEHILARTGYDPEHYRLTDSPTDQMLRDYEFQD
jgi:hypothetical protein